MTRQFLFSSICLSVLTLSACGSGGDASEPLPAPNQSEPLTTGSFPTPTNPLPGAPAPSNPIPEDPDTSEPSDPTEETDAAAEEPGQISNDDFLSELSEDVNADAANYRLGIQIAGISSDMTAWMFTDLMKSSGLKGESVKDARHGWFYSRNNIWITGRPENIQTDAHGWPVSMTLGDGTMADSIFTSVMTSDVENAYEAGVYTLSYEGEGTLVFENANIIEQTSNQILLQYPGSGALTISITQTDPQQTGDYLRNIRLTRPGAMEGEIFSPHYLDYLKSSRVVRTTNLYSDAALYAKPGTTDMFTGSNGWNMRSTTQSSNWGAVSGVPYEAMTVLADQSISDLWLNIPLAADDEYISSMAALFLAELKVNRILYIELGNELARRTYPQRLGREYALEQAQQRWPDAMNSDLLSGYSLLAKENLLISNWQAARTLEVQAIFDSVWGTEADRVVTVLSGTVNDTMKNHQYNAMLLEGLLLQEFENRDAPGMLIDTLAVDPLVVNNSANQFSVDSKDAMLTDAINFVDGTGQYYEEAHAPGLRYAVRSAAELAQRYGIALTAYSGGHDFNASSYLNYQVLKSSQMYDVYESVFSVWQEEGGGLFIAGKGISGAQLPEYCASSAYVRADQVSTIGLKQTQLQTDTDAHMLRAFNDEMRAIGQIK